MCIRDRGSTVPHAEAGNLTGVRVSNHEGTSRIVLDVSEMPVSWTQSYNEETHALTLNLGGTTNGLTGPISQNDKKTGVLKGIEMCIRDRGNCLNLLKICIM